MGDAWKGNKGKANWKVCKTIVIIILISFQFAGNFLLLIRSYCHFYCYYYFIIVVIFVIIIFSRKNFVSNRLANRLILGRNKGTTGVGVQEKYFYRKGGGEKGEWEKNFFFLNF